MPMTQQDREWHKKFERLPSGIKQTIDEAFNTLVKEIKRYEGLVCANDDRAEQVIASLGRYVVESNPNNSDVQLRPDPDDESFELHSVKSKSPHFINVIFTSVWDGDTAFQSKARYFPATGKVVVTETYDTDSHNDLNTLTREYITLPDNQEIEVCRECHEHVMRTKMVPGLGKTLVEATECANPDCSSHDEIEYDEAGNTYSG